MPGAADTDSGLQSSLDPEKTKRQSSDEGVRWSVLLVWSQFLFIFSLKCLYPIFFSVISQVGSNQSCFSFLSEGLYQKFSIQHHSKMSSNKKDVLLHPLSLHLMLSGISTQTSPISAQNCLSSSIISSFSESDWSG